MFDLVKSDILRYYQLTGRNKSTVSFGGIVGAFLGMKMTPVILYRMSHFCFKKRIPIVGKIFALVNFIVFGVEIAANCKIGGGFFIPHSQGIVIGASEIGKNATIYQQVTLGAKNIDIPFNHANRPVLGDNVVVASGAKILGGIRIGDNVIVAANAVVMQSCDNNVLLVGIPAVVKKSI
ncbi:serine O-acetyltransferase [Yokenella regensburgei]|uniref:Acetyltransferase n=1 Tax=Yokenella regensburgei TaxID=158877 RepID=A0AB38FZS0_9ENTR|nr:serine acetyltransferase [Yokenella regensburgei]KFD21692.1 serine acetyltransferase [Yokenella regensburgei ATCC 49455]SQA64088.1 Serine acetyltransferase [Yokenella regensburgei]SQA66198.1 Serine acetyltransferase [Yokenella regensburgei]SUQ04817.1 Serine acetyltransferase [Yokenella regensburgei]